MSSHNEEGPTLAEAYKALGIESPATDKEGAKEPGRKTLLMPPDEFEILQAQLPRSTERLLILVQCQWNVTAEIVGFGRAFISIIYEDGWDLWSCCKESSSYDNDGKRVMGRPERIISGLTQEEALIHSLVILHDIANTALSALLPNRLRWNTLRLDDRLDGLDESGRRDFAQGDTP